MAGYVTHSDTMAAGTNLRLADGPGTIEVRRLGQLTYLWAETDRKINKDKLVQEFLHP